MVVAEFADDDLFLSVLTVGEIAKGIALLAAGRKKKALGTWLRGLETNFHDRILSIDSETARLWGEITARLKRPARSSRRSMACWLQPRCGMVFTS